MSCLFISDGTIPMMALSATKRPLLLFAGITRDGERSAQLADIVRRLIDHVITIPPFLEETT